MAYPTGSCGSAPLSFPPPTFGAGRIISQAGGARDHSDSAGYILVSEGTGRRWLAIDSIRECQFGEVVRAVELFKNAFGQWVHAAGPPAYVAIKVCKQVYGGFSLVEGRCDLFFLGRMESRMFTAGVPDGQCNKNIG